MHVGIKTKTFTYDNSVAWKDLKRGLLGSDGKPDLEVASPPEFKGHPGIWTPEDLLVAAVNTRAMMTFLSNATREKISLLSYEADATGTLEMADGKFRFTRIVLRPRITVARSEDREKALAAFRAAEKNCLVANSLTSSVEGKPEILVKS
jgi:organic hydroperoxide reductase OsmC/OhrA